MTTFKDWCIFFGSVALLVCRSVFAPSFEFDISPKQIRPGEHFTLQISLYSDQESDDPPKLRDELLLQSKAFQVLDSESVIEEGIAQWKYTLTAYQPGETILPPIEVSQGPHSYSTERTSIQIRSSRQAQDDSLRPAFGRVPLPVDWFLVLKWTFLMSLLGSAVYVSYRRYKQIIPLPPPAPVIALPSEVPQEWLQKQLDLLSQEISREPNNPDHIDKLSSILKEFLTRLHQVPARSWTTQEVETKQSQDPIIKKILPIFERCDEFKFTGRGQDFPKTFPSELLNHSKRAFQS